VKNIKEMLLAIMFIAISAPSAWAFDQPSSGTFGYEIYEFMNLMLTGSVGVCVAIAITAYCIYFVLRSHVFGAITCAIAALMVVKIEDIVYSLGAMIV
jgi:hypothetical protein